MNEQELGSRGQITIPAEIIKKLGPQPRDRVLFKAVEGAYSVSKEIKKAVSKLPYIS